MTYSSHGEVPSVGATGTVGSISTSKSIYTAPTKEEMIPTDQVHALIHVQHVEMYLEAEVPQNASLMEDPTYL